MRLLVPSQCDRGGSCRQRRLLAALSQSFSSRLGTVDVKRTASCCRRRAHIAGSGAGGNRSSTVVMCARAMS